jgi:hypothetical protein
MTDTSDLSRTLQNTHSVPKWLAEAEDRAQRLVNELALCVKLKALKPQIVEVQADFKKLKGSQTIFGCRSFKEFCEQKLGRTEQAVYAMLGDYSKKQKAKKNRGTHNSTGHQEFADEDVQRPPCSPSCEDGHHSLHTHPCDCDRLHPANSPEGVWRSNLERRCHSQHYGTAHQTPRQRESPSNDG